MKAYKFGIELETVVNEYDSDDLINAVSASKLPYTCSGDSSINTGYDYSGIEWKAKEALTYTELQRSIKPFCKLLDKYGTNVNASTGFHVHISNKRFFNKKNLDKIIYAWTAIEDVMYATQPRSRYSNSYCKRLLQKYATDTQSLPTAKSKLISALGDVDRYFSLNLQSLEVHGTIECRLHSGTTDSMKILAWVELLIAFYEYCLNRYNHEEVEKLFITPISDEKIKMVFDMLDIKNPIRSHFEQRIRTFGFQLLIEQQKSAIELLKLKPKLKKARDKYQKANTELNDISNEQKTYLRAFDRGL